MSPYILDSCVHCDCKLNQNIGSEHRNTKIKFSGPEEEIYISISDAISYIYGLSNEHLTSELQWRLSTTDVDCKFGFKTEFPHETQDVIALCNPCISSFTELYRAHRNFNKLSTEESLLQAVLKKWTHCLNFVKTEVENDCDTDQGQNEDDILQFQHDVGRDSPSDLYTMIEDKILLKKDDSTWSDCSSNEESEFKSSVECSNNLFEMCEFEAAISDVKEETVKREQGKSGRQTHSEITKNLSVVIKRLDSKYLRNSIRSRGKQAKNSTGATSKPIKRKYTKIKDKIKDAKTKKKQKPLKASKIKIKREAKEKSIATDVLRYVDYIVCCQTQYTKKDDYIKHKEQYHPGEILKESCAICDNSVAILNMGIHVRACHNHTNGLTYHCLHCNKIFLEEASLRAHSIQTHAPASAAPNCELHAEPLESFGRIYSVKGKKYAKISCKSAKPCPDCGKVVFNMPDHIETHSTERKTHKCALCDKEYFHKISLRDHERTHEETYEPVQCNICGVKLTHRRSLNRHIRVSHILEAQELICQHCGKILKSKHHLNRHLSQHADEGLDRELFKCTTCSKYLKDSVNLRKHILRFHTPNRKVFTCETCGKQTKNMTNMRIHLKVHDPTRIVKFSPYQKKK